MYFKYLIFSNRGLIPNYENGVILFEKEKVERTFFHPGIHSLMPKTVTAGPCRNQER